MRFPVSGLSLMPVTVVPVTVVPVTVVPVTVVPVTVVPVTDVPVMVGPFGQHREGVHRWGNGAAAELGEAAAPAGVCRAPQPLWSSECPSAGTCTQNGLAMLGPLGVF